MSHAARLTAHDAASAALASLDDDALQELLDTATPLGTGIGGKAALLEVAGTPVFVKRVPLTDLERQPEHLRSTANLFDVPAFCHYGIGDIGAAGFGAWRELAAHTLTTQWVLGEEYAGFPLMHHWRVLPDSTPLPEELADIDRAVAYWDDSPQVRARIEALAASSASIALFLEYIPRNLHEWLGEQAEAGGPAIDEAAAMVERELAAGTTFMNSRGLFHFDAHFENILTDGRRLYFADYGLALSSAFRLSPEEAAFLDRRRGYDRDYTATYLVNWLATALCGLHPADREGRATLVRACARGEVPAGVPEGIASLLLRNAPTAAAMGDFSRAFRSDSRHAPYPAEELRRLVGLSGTHNTAGEGDPA
ncbi:hypothetical protein [Streptacidiphilus jiangxiensis]|nr:hypothetical protein [Streptacidiphilus jiangxiensis]